MSCPRCAEICRCLSATGEAVKPPRLQARFEPEGTSVPPAAVSTDPEVDDGSEQRFAASLETSDGATVPRFVVEDESSSPSQRGAGQNPSYSLEGGSGEPAVAAGEEATSASAPGAEPSSSAPGIEGAWRDEVAARLTSYRSRRRSRGPRYPSLRLKFDAPPEDSSAEDISENPHDLAVGHSPVSTAATARAIRPAPETVPNETAKIIPFPWSGNAPPIRLDELAEPVLDRPRIVEVPETAPPPPALGGILIDPVEQPLEERRPGIDIPLQSAPLGRRLAAALADGILVLTACAASGYVFFRVTGYLPGLPQAVGAAALTSELFWIAYQYLLLVYSGITPGLWLAKLRLNRFDGSPARRSLRRWRVLASLLSGVSLGLGYAWCFLDEDALCWHDRITRTYLAPKK